jgi:chemotaxis protein methyltransferase CheR
MAAETLSDAGFHAVAQFFFDQAGIRLRPDKRPLVAGRLARRASACGSPSLDAYVREVLADAGGVEARALVDELTTNETYFFREPAHFEHLAGVVRALPPQGGPVRVWSAASSTGEEAYSIAMTLARHAGTRAWEVVGTDLSTRVVESARRGLFVEERGRQIPDDERRRWCLRGTGDYAGTFLVHRDLRARVRFEVANLTEPQPGLGLFDVAFLRNVLIYFEPEMKEVIVGHVAAQVRPGGWLYTGHAESLHSLRHGLQPVRPAIYRVPEVRS